MSTDVFKQTQTCGGNGDVDEDSQMGRLECFETLSSGTDSNATDERTKVPSYSLSFSSVDGVESRSTSGHSDSAEQPSHDDGDDTDNTKCSPNSSLKRAFPSPGKSPKAKAKRPASSGGKQSSSSSTPGPSVDYPGMSEHVDSSCYDFDPFQVHNFAESFKSPTAFPTPNYFSPECTTPSLQNSNSYESPEAPDLEDLEFDSSKGKVTLWQFLLQLLLDHRYAELIRWTNNAGEFVLLRAEEVARLWGLRKDNNHRMNYDKLSRALRYYYQKNIIRKVHGHKFVYRFIGLNNLKGLTFPTAHLAAEQSKENSIMQLGGRFPLPETSKSPSSKKSPKTNRNSTTSAEFPGNGPSKGYAGFAKGLVPGLGAASANLYFSTTPPMVENTAVGSNFLGTSLRFPDAVSRHSSAMFPLVPVPSAPSVSAAGAAATANSSSIESLHKISRTLGLHMPEHPPFPFYWGFPSADCKKVVDSTVSSSLLSAKTTTSTGNPMTGSQYDFERFLTGFSGVSDSNQVAAATNQVIQGMEMAHERANPKKETMGTMNQEDRLNVIASLACREVLQNILQRNASFHQDHGQGKPLLHFQNPSPTRNTAQASNLSVTASDSFHGRSPTPNCKCSCHLAPTSDLCKAETDELATGPLHSTPNAPLLAGPEKAKGWNEIVADLTKEWANQWRPTTSTQDPGNQSDPDHLSDLHYQRHLINMNRLREQINLLASEERKQAASRLSAVTVNSRAPAERSNNLPTADWNFSAYAPFLNNSMEFQPGNSPNVPSLPRATASGPGKQCADEGYVWMPVQVGLIGKWIAMLSGQMRNEVRREGTVSANHSSDLPQPPSTVGHANPHRSREFNCSLSGF